MQVQARCILILLVLLASFPSRRACAQSDTITVNSDLVLVPALVKTHDGQRVYGLTAGDFTLLDNGVRQTLRLQEDSGDEPLALAVLVQTGGHAAAHLKDYQRIDLLLEDIIGAVPHTVAVISFDSEPYLEQGFSENIEKAAETITSLEPGDDGAAILDAVAFGVRQLHALPLSYRRAILLLSETFDNDSKISLDDAVRAVGDNNTIIYSLAFSSGRATAAHHAAKIPVPNSDTAYSQTPYEKGGCMSRDPNADPDAHGSRAKQAWNCVGDLVPPLRIAQLAFDAAKDELRKNVPQTLARLTGGEFYSFKDANSLTERMGEIRNNLPNRYLLSFRPAAPATGPHALELRVAGRPEYIVLARVSYWMN